MGAARALQLLLVVLEWPFRKLGRGVRWHLLPYLRSCYLTLRYVDEWSSFPAIRLGGPDRVRIQKAPGSRLILHGPLRTRFLPGAREPACLVLGRGSRFVLQGEFAVGSNVRFTLAHGAVLEIGGRGPGVYSGITSDCMVYVKRRLRLGKDVVLGWRTVVMDTDWHPIDGRVDAQDTELGDHVWVCSGAQVLKGARIGKDSIVASGAVVLRGDYPARSLVAGLPAKAIGKAPDWSYW